MEKAYIKQISGALFGVAVGDALGAPLEFMDAAEIERKYRRVWKMIGGGWLNVAPGEVTDDTQMTVAVAEGIIEAPKSPIEAIGHKFVSWIAHGPKDVGGTCQSSIGKAMAMAPEGFLPRGEVWPVAAERTHEEFGGRSAGNGSLMRTVYVGLYYGDEERVAHWARRISEMTHYDRVASDACELYSRMVCRMVAEPELEARQRILFDLLKGHYEAGHPCSYQTICKPGFRPSPTGYVLDSFAAALWCILKTSCFEEAVVKAVNLGGDADTIGAITGGLAGALYGYDAIPDEWVSALEPEVSRKLQRLAIEAHVVRNYGERANRNGGEA